jgi:phosphohistidine phosphatase
MDLILWRHAEAEDGFPDSERTLTPKGHRQAARIAKWLRKRLPEGTRVLVSPAERAQQTAGALTTSFETVDEIAPGASASAVLKAAGWPDANGAVLIVGHQPALGQAVASLLSGGPRDWNLKKGAIVWLAREPGAHAQTILRAALSPNLA